MIGEKILELRKSKGLKQEQLAKASEISRVTISQYERDKTFPSPENLEKLTKALKLPKDYFEKLVIESKSDHETKISTDVLKRKFKEVFHFSRQEQNAVINVIDLITRNKELISRLERVRQVSNPD